MEESTTQIIETTTEVLTENQQIVQNLNNIEVLMTCILGILVVFLIYGMFKAIQKVFNWFF